MQSLFKTLFLALSISTVLAGCLASSPRYKSAGDSTETTEKDDGYRFAAKVKAEEKAEDDKKVDLRNIEAEISPGTDSTVVSSITPNGLNRDKVLLDVIGYLGTPYSYGGSTKNGMDCSGFTTLVYGGALNRKLPRSTREQYQVGAEVTKSELQFGDLVFFNTTGRTPSHVGIFIEGDLFAHASVSYGVTISSLESTYYRKRFVGARRVVE
ncbi:MAG: C40 family peptidase [Bacteroidota bacterium]